LKKEALSLKLHALHQGYEAVFLCSDFLLEIETLSPLLIAPSIIAKKVFLKIVFHGSQMPYPALLQVIPVIHNFQKKK